VASRRRRRLGRASHQSDCEKFSIVYFLNRSRRLRSIDQRGFRNGADVQIGGGVRVGDAFQAIVGSKSVAIRATVVLCQNFSGRDLYAPEASNQKLRTREMDVRHPEVAAKADLSGRVRVGQSVAAEQVLFRPR
jgi:hypothetical protein